VERKRERGGEADQGVGLSWSELASGQMRGREKGDSE